MASFSVLTYKIVTSYTGSWDGNTLMADNYIHVVLDDVTNLLTVEYTSSAEYGVGVIDTLTTGPHLYYGYDGAVQLLTSPPYHQYCVGLDLYQIGTNNIFPYATLAVSTNNSECQLLPVCDLEISSVYSITPTSTASSLDGAIVGSATSSNGTIKFAIDDPDFEYGSNYTLEPLDALNLWVSINLSSEPMVWTTGVANPYMTLTAPGLLVPALSDWIGPAAPALTAGVTYKYNFQFTVESDVTDFLYIHIVVANVFYTVRTEKILYGYAVPGGLVLAGTFEFVAEASDIYLAVYVEYPSTSGVFNNNLVTIDSFTDASGLPVSEGQLDLNFTGLISGPHTIYAKDAAGCQDSLVIDIPVTTAYGVRHRLEFKDSFAISGKWHRIDILERAYTGDTLEMKGSGNPAKIRYEGDRDDPSNVLMASDLAVEILVETEGEYTHLHQADDRKYKIIHYYGDDLVTMYVYHAGFVIPEFHSEPYLFEPYYFTVTSADQVGEFKRYNFSDLNGNRLRGEISVIKLLAEILKYTGLELNIRSGVNVFDTGMDTAASDDPLAQAYVDTRIFYLEDPAETWDVVIVELLKPFRAQLFQSMGVWWIIRLSDAVGTFAYREFDSNGDYVSNSTFDPVVMLGSQAEVHAGSGVMFGDSSQVLTYLKNYGSFKLTHDLRKDGNLIDSGSFEEEYIVELASGNKTFEGWGVLLGQAGIRYGWEAVENGDSKGAFFFDFSSAVGLQADTLVYSEVIPIDSIVGHLRFKFQYFVAPEYQLPYVRIAWTLKYKITGGSYIWVVYESNGRLGYAYTESKNDIYVTDYNSWETFDLLVVSDNLGFPEGVESVEVGLWFHDHYGKDFTGETPFRAFSLRSLSKPSGTRKMVHGEGTEAGNTLVYIAKYDLLADSYPYVVRPDDFTGGKDYLWLLEEIIELGPSNSIVNRVKFDNLAISFYPKLFTPTTQVIDPPEELEYPATTDVLNKEKFELPVLLGDMIRLDVLYTMNEANTYRSYFRLADGTPTRYWTRTGVAEEKGILQILLEDYTAQFAVPQRRLSGVKYSNIVLHFVNCLRDTRDDTRYRPMTFEFDVKNARYTPDLAGVVAGADGEPPVAYGEFSNTEFSIDYLIGS